MQRRPLGSSGFEVSTIGLGTWAIGGHMWGGQDDSLSIEAIHAAIDHGVNWIDTAPDLRVRPLRGGRRTGGQAAAGSTAAAHLHEVRPG